MTEIKPPVAPRGLTTYPHDLVLKLRKPRLVPQEVRELMAEAADAITERQATLIGIDASITRLLERASNAEIKVAEVDARLAEGAQARGLLHKSIAETETLLRDAHIQIEAKEATIMAVVHTVGGTVEGRPTERVNFLQRVRQLVEAEAEVERLSAALDAMTRERDVRDEVIEGLRVEVNELRGEVERLRAEGTALKRLASEGAESAHRYATGFSSRLNLRTNGHDGDFEECRHQDCVLVRAALASPVPPQKET